MTLSNYPTVFKSNMSEANWVDAPDFGGAMWVAHRSLDGRRAIVAARESGTMTYTYPFSEFYVVLKGSATVTPHGDDAFELAVGDFGFFPEGSTSDWDMRDDFTLLAILDSSNLPIDL